MNNSNIFRKQDALCHAAMSVLDPSCVLNEETKFKSGQKVKIKTVADYGPVSAGEEFDAVWKQVGGMPNQMRLNIDFRGSYALRHPSIFYNAATNKVEMDKRWELIEQTNGTDKSRSYSLVFHTDEDFNRILKLDPSIFGYSDYDQDGIELFWVSKVKRDKARNILKKEYGITVDTFDFV